MSNCKTDEYADPEDYICFSATVKDSNNNITEYRFDFPHKEYTERWSDQFENAFLYNHEYRKQFEVREENVLELDYAPDIPPLNTL